VLALVIVLTVAAVVVYIVRLVKPKRVRLRAGFGKITILDFEADAGSQSGEPHGQPEAADDLRELPFSSGKDDAALSMIVSRAALGSSPVSLSWHRSVSK
jgi:hypothetical protein